MEARLSLVAVIFATSFLFACGSSKKTVASDELENSPPLAEAPLTSRVLRQNRTRAEKVAECHTENGRDGDGQAYVLLIVASNGDVLDSYGFHPRQPTEAFQKCVGASMVGLRYGFDLEARGIFVQPLSVSSGGVVEFQSPSAGIGSLDNGVVKDILDDRKAEWLECARSDTKGRAVVQFVIAPDGVVRMPDVASSTLSDPSVERCLSNVARELLFPRPEGGAVVVNYPIRF